jgi:hypothetical protein
MGPVVLIGFPLESVLHQPTKINCVCQHQKRHTIITTLLATYSIAAPGLYNAELADSANRLLFDKLLPVNCSRSSFCFFKFYSSEPFTATTISSILQCRSIPYLAIHTSVLTSSTCLKFDVVPCNRVDNVATTVPLCAALCGVLLSCNVWSTSSCLLRSLISRLTRYVNS